LSYAQGFWGRRDGRAFQLFDGSQLFAGVGVAAGLLIEAGQAVVGALGGGDEADGLFQQGFGFGEAAAAQ
jgi:hypothetical protein